MAIQSVLTSYDAHGLPQNSPTAKRYQKHPRGVVRCRFPRDYYLMEQSLAGAKWQDPSAVTLSTPTVVHTAPVNTVVGNIGTTFTGSGAVPTVAYALVANPSGYFKIVGTQLQVAAALPATGPIAISIKSTTSPEGLSVTTPFSIAVT